MLLIKFFLTNKVLWQYPCSEFSLGRLHMGGQVQGDKALMGGTHEGPSLILRDNFDSFDNFDRLYHKLKILLLLSCNYTMQFIGYDSIKTR